jgi:hypothetical protein
VKLNWKHKTFLGAMTLLLLCSGCGGVSASRSVSPLNMFMPSTLLMQTDPKSSPTNTVPHLVPVQQLAQLQ